jgi:hypothetical protein
LPDLIPGKLRHQLPPRDLPIKPSISSSFPPSFHSKPCHQAAEIARRSPAYLQAFPDESVAAGEPCASYSIPSLFISSGASP